MDLVVDHLEAEAQQEAGRYKTVCNIIACKVADFWCKEKQIIAEIFLCEENFA